MGIEWSALWLSLKLASVTVVLLLLLGTPLAWWLARGRARGRVWIEAAVAMPLVLPPTILGFYLLLLFSPQGALGGGWLRLTGDTLSFSFTGLVLASLLYSLPFVVQPLQNAFAELSQGLLDSAAALGAGPLDRFFSVAVPLALRGYLTAIVLGFAHTLGEFGVVLMVGGSIPGETRVVAIAIYEAVERMDYAAAHRLSLVLLAFSYLTVLAVYALNRRVPRVLS